MTEVKTVPVANAMTTATTAQSDKLTADTKPDAAGVLQDPEISERVDTTHPAVDDNPRKGLPEKSNQIDFNDPTITGAEAVRRNLEAQGINAGPVHDENSGKD